MLTSPVLAGWDNRTDVLYLANDPTGERHPKSVVQTLFVVADRAEGASLCLAYGNNFTKRNKGKVKVVVEITRQVDEENGEAEALQVETIQMTKHVKDNTAVQCLDVDPLLVGDSLVTTFTFKNTPRLKNPRGPGAINVVTALSPDPLTVDDFFGAPSLPGEEPDPAPGPNPGPNPNPNPNPNPTPNPGPGGLSAADERAIDALLNLTPRSQLWLAKNGQPKKWVFVPPTVTVISGNKIDPATAGYGNTPAEAAADLASKPRGYRLPAGRALSAADRNGILCYARINANGGPTSIRRDGGRGYWGEWYRPGRGSNHQGPFSNIAGAANYLRQSLGC